MKKNCEVILGKGTKMCIKAAFDERSDNSHLTMFGISGCGKSTQIEFMENAVVEKGKTVIEIDFSDSSVAKKSLAARSHVVDVRNTTMISPLSRRCNVYGVEESMVDFSKRVSDLLAGAFRLTMKQNSVLYKAVKKATEKWNKISFYHVIDCLDPKDSSATSVQVKLQYFSDIDVFGEDSAGGSWNKFFEHSKPIHVLSLAGFPVAERKVVAELLLDDLCNFLTECGPGQNDFILILDECQNLRFTQNMPMSFFMSQARKYGCGVWLATQSASYFKRDELAFLYQSALILNFQPNADERLRIARKLSQNPKEQSQILDKLTQLKRGEFLASGRFIKKDGTLSEYAHLVVSNLIESDRV